MGSRYTVRSTEFFHFVTFTVVNWIDLFIRPEYSQIFLESVRHCQTHKGLLLGAWCLMTNHAHLIVKSGSSKPLAGIIRDLKSFSSRQIRKELGNNRQESRRNWILPIFRTSGCLNANNKDFQLWQAGYHAVELSTNHMVDQRLDYIHFNPVKAGFVDEPEHWRYSSARDYAGTKGLLDIYFLD